MRAHSSFPLGMGADYQYERTRRTFGVRWTQRWRGWLDILGSHQETAIPSNFARRKMLTARTMPASVIHWPYVEN